MPDRSFIQYRRKQIAELRPYVEGEDVSHVSISPEDVKAGSPKRGDMIARNPKNHADQWLVAQAYFLDNFEALTAAEQAEPAPAARSGSVKVKQLEWVEARISDRWERYTASTPFGLYEAMEWSDGSFGGSLPAEDYDEPSVEFRSKTLEDAKAYAQADYERRILSALEPAEPATDAEPYLWLHPWDGSTSKSLSDISARCPKDGPQPIPLYARPPESRLLEGLEAAIRAAKLALFVIRKQGVMPNSSWESGFNSDLKKAEDALIALAQEDGR